MDEELTSVLRVVEDKDGHTNIRSGPSLDDRVVGKIQSGAVVTTAWDEKSEWARIDDDSGSSRDLFVHSSRLKKLKDWKQFKTQAKASDSGTVAAGELEAEVKGVPFVEKDHKIGKDKDGYIEKVDGREIWGTDGTLPTKTLVLSVKIDGKAVTLPPEATHDLYQPNVETLSIITPGKTEEQAVVVMWNSDGAGGYMVAWSFVKGKYAGRTIFVP